MTEKWREGTANIGDMRFAIQYLIDNMPDTEAYNELNSHIFTDPEWYAFKFAIEALEKRIPQKPKVDDDGYWFCPSCGLYDIECDKPDYCPMCGQALDWEVEDD